MRPSNNDDRLAVFLGFGSRGGNIRFKVNGLINIERN
jgi:hypothetical protein